MRIVILVVALAFILVFAALTLTEISQHGLDILSVASLLILAILSFGVIGALLHKPDE